MDNDTGTSGTIRRFIRWATTPPQAYGVYFLCLILVWLVSFYAGSLKPKKAADLGPPSISAPRN